MPDAPIIKIKCSRPVYRRAGLKFSQGVNEFAAKNVTDEMLDIIKQDPVLAVIKEAKSKTKAPAKGK